MKINIWISKVLLRFVSSLLKVSSKQNTERCDHISFFYSIRSKNFSRSSELAFAFVCVCALVDIFRFMLAYDWHWSHTTDTYII